MNSWQHFYTAFQTLSTLLTLIYQSDQKHETVRIEEIILEYNLYSIKFF